MYEIPVTISARFDRVFRRLFQIQGSRQITIGRIAHIAEIILHGGSITLYIIDEDDTAFFQSGGDHPEYRKNEIRPSVKQHKIGFDAFKCFEGIAFRGGDMIRQSCFSDIRPRGFCFMVQVFGADYFSAVFTGSFARIYAEMP